MTSPSLLSALTAIAERDSRIARVAERPARHDRRTAAQPRQRGVFSPHPAIALIVVVGALIGTLMLSATATADSIVYVKDGNVWLTSPDAARQYQVTFDGGYSSPSQADDGTIVALQAKRFVRMNRSGQRLGDPVAGMGTPPVPQNDFFGPYEPRVSPDGKRIAYWFGQYTDYYSYGCNCYLFHLESQSAWTWSDRFTDPSTQSEYQKGITQPEWLTNDRVLAAYSDFWDEWLDLEIGTGTGYVDGSSQWWYQFKDAEGYNFFPTDPALSPDGSKLALANGADPNTKSQLLLAAVTGPAWVGEPPYENDYLGNSAVEQPILQCAFDYGSVVNPTWSPDSSRFAVGRTDGVHVEGVPSSFDCSSVSDRLLVAGGAEPDWGPADVVMSDKPSPPAPAPASAGQTPTPNAQGSPQNRSGALISDLRISPSRFRAAHGGPAIAARIGGAIVSFSAAGPARVAIKVRRTGGKAVGGTIRTDAKPGANRLRFRGRIGGRALPPGRYTLSLRAKALAGGGSAAATVPFRIAR